MLLLVLVCSLLTVATGTMRVLSTDRGRDLPEREGYAEMLTSLDLSSFTVCGRVLTHQYRTLHRTAAIISLGNTSLLGENNNKLNSCEQIL